jgi:muramoyltetrapeptide carboxypeptidase
LQTDILLPDPLSPGDTIGIVAPAGAFDKTRFQAGLERLKEVGFKVAVPEAVFNRHRYMAGTDAGRADLIHQMFADPAIQAIMCARGGFGSMRILPLLDFQLISRHPKLFAGFSDISVLLTVICEQARMVTLHAPVITSLADADNQTEAALFSGLAAPSDIRIKPDRPKTLAGGRAIGPVCGGNLASLTHLIGTLYQPDFSGRLLFLEDTNEAPYRIDRMLTHIRLAGCLEQVAGVMLGRFHDCGKPSMIDDIVKEHFSHNIPILGGLAVGHGGTNLTLPLGLTATLDADEGILSYHGSAAT